MAQNVRPIRGMNDILPPEGDTWLALETAVADVLGAYGYRHVRLPLLEYTELFRRSIGDATGTLSIGRAAGCEITLDDTFISQLHARVTIGQNGVVIEDLGSTNGTYLNRKRVTAPVVVQPGDVIQVGSTVLELQP